MPSSIRRTTRVIIDTDAKNEADDQFAIVHALLSPTLDVRGLIAAHFGINERVPDGMLASRQEIDLLLDLMGKRNAIRVANGAGVAMSGPEQAVDSPGARLIIEEARRDDGPLFAAFLGPLTDMASALLMDPGLNDLDVTVVWIGGPPYDGLVPAYWPEYNLANDIAAANVVFASRVAVWQVPMSVYSCVGVGYAELYQKVKGRGALGDYLVQQLVEWNDAWHPTPIEHRSLGDSPAISAILNPRGAVWRRRAAPRFASDGSMLPAPNQDRSVLTCEAIDTRYLLEDMFAKIQAAAPAGRPDEHHDYPRHALDS